MADSTSARPHPAAKPGCRGFCLLDAHCDNVLVIKILGIPDYARIPSKYSFNQLVLNGTRLTALSHTMRLLTRFSELEPPRAAAAANGLNNFWRQAQTAHSPA